VLSRLVSELDPLAKLIAMEIAIGATDLAESLVARCAELLFHIPLAWAIVITLRRVAAVALQEWA